MKHSSEIQTCLFRRLLQGFGTGSVFAVWHSLLCQKDSVGPVGTVSCLPKMFTLVMGYLLYVLNIYSLSLCQ